MATFPNLSVVLNARGAIMKVPPAYTYSSPGHGPGPIPSESTNPSLDCGSDNGTPSPSASTEGAEVTAQQHRGVLLARSGGAAVRAGVDRRHAEEDEVQRAEADRRGRALVREAGPGARAGAPDGDVVDRDRRSFGAVGGGVDLGEFAADVEERLGGAVSHSQRLDGAVRAPAEVLPRRAVEDCHAVEVPGVRSVPQELAAGVHQAAGNVDGERAHLAREPPETRAHGRPRARVLVPRRHRLHGSEIVEEGALEVDLAARGVAHAAAKHVAKEEGRRDARVCLVDGGPFARRVPHVDVAAGKERGAAADVQVAGAVDDVEVVAQLEAPREPADKGGLGEEGGEGAAGEVGEAPGGGEGLAPPRAGREVDGSERAPEQHRAVGHVDERVDVLVDEPAIQ